MQAVKIFIDKDISISLNAAKYTFKILMGIAGFPHHFVRKNDTADIVYSADKKYGSACKIFIKAEQELLKNAVDSPVVVQENDIYFFLIVLPVQIITGRFCIGEIFEKYFPFHGQGGNPLCNL